MSARPSIARTRKQSSEEVRCNPSTSEALVRLFNDFLPIGAPVLRIDDLGHRHKTETRSPAWVMASGHAVVQVKGLPGCFALERIEVDLERLTLAFTPVEREFTVPARGDIIEALSPEAK